MARVLPATLRARSLRSCVQHRLLQFGAPRCSSNFKDILPVVSVAGLHPADITQWMSPLPPKARIRLLLGIRAANDPTGTLTISH